MPQLAPNNRIIFRRKGFRASRNVSVIFLPLVDRREIVLLNMYRNLAHKHPVSSKVFRSQKITRWGQILKKALSHGASQACGGDCIWMANANNALKQGEIQRISPSLLGKSRFLWDRVTGVNHHSRVDLPFALAVIGREFTFAWRRTVVHHLCRERGW